MADVAQAAASTIAAIASLYVWSVPREAFVLAVRDVLAAARVPRGAKGYFRREHPVEIMKRTVSLSVAAVAVVTYIGWPQLLLRGGAATSTHGDDTKEMLVLLCSLWLGPLLEAPHEFCSEHVVGRIHGIAQHPWGALRELVVAPVAEELLFRYGTHYFLRHRSVGVRMLVGSTLFAAAHMHLVVNHAVEAAAWYMVEAQHASSSASMGTTACAPETSIAHDAHAAAEIRRRAWGDAWLQMQKQCCVVFGYGLLSAWLYECCCAQSVVAAACGHALCNFLGVPKFLFLHRGQQNHLEAGRSLHGAATVGRRWSTARCAGAAAAYAAGIGLFLWRARALSSSRVH